MSKVDMVMPQMGESIAEGTIIKWHKKEGDQVERDEVILEISTDKVDSEIPSPESGTVKEILFPEGETVKVGEVIAYIDTEGDGAEAAEEQAEEKEEKEEKAEEPAEAKKDEEKEKEEEREKKKEEPAEAKAEQPEPEEKPAEKEPAEEEKEVERPAAAEGRMAEFPRTDRSRKKFYSPLVRSIARAEGIEPEEIEQIDGSGANGRVTKQDLLDYIKSREVGAPAKEAPRPTAAPSLQPEYSDERTEVIPMDNMRKSIAQHMVKSVQTSPHVFAVSEADMTNLVKFRSEHKEEFQQKAGAKLTYMPFIVQACARALLDYPMVNSSVDGDKIIRKKYINIGMAVALENNGLIVPVIKGADGMNIVGLARTANDLAQRARNKKLTPEEVQDGTFSITNMGVFGSLMGLPVINQPQVAILGVGTIKKRPVVINDAIAIRDMMYISLSFDHRIVDGSLAGQFLERIAHYLTNFDTNNIL